MYHFFTGTNKKIEKCLKQDREDILNVKNQEAILLSMGTSIDNQMKENEFSDISILQMFKEQFKPCKNALRYLKSNFDVTDFKNVTGFNFQEYESLRSTKPTIISDKISSYFAPKIIDSKAMDKLEADVKNSVQQAYSR